MNGVDKGGTMREKQITITQKELDGLVQKEFEKRRRILFDMCVEGYEPDITYKEKKFLGNRFIVINGKNWDKIWKYFTKISEDLMDAREILEITEPFYKRYHDLHEQDVRQEYPFTSFDEYIKMVDAEYTSEEFERVREEFEEYLTEDEER